MGKLQLYITIAYKGYREMLDINADSMVKSGVHDLSHLMGKIKYKTGRMSIFFMLKYTAGGVFITALRTIPVQKPDHLAAWVFIPYDIKISTSEIEDVMEVVIKAISNSKITSDTYSELCKLFDKDYDNIPYAAAVAPNYGAGTAYRYYGDVTGYILSDLIGTKRYQTSYLTYSEVVLADKGLVSGIDGRSLTDEPLDQMVKLSPPASPDQAYRPTIFGCEFDRPYLAPLMGTVEIKWMHGNSVAAVQSVMVNRPNMRPDSPSLEELLGPSASQAAAPHQPAHTQHVAYAASDTQETPTSRIPMADTPPHAEHRHHERPQPQADRTTAPKPAHFQRQSTTPATDHPASPRGMKTASLAKRFKSLLDKLRGMKPRYISPDTRLKATWASIGFLGGVALTLLGTCIHQSLTDAESKVIDLSSDTLTVNTPVETVDVKDVTHQNTTHWPGDEIKEPEVDTSMEAALTYLDGFKTWNKKELDRYPELAGLYDDMNNFNLNRLVSHWGPKLKKSTRFQKIVAHARQAIKRGKKPRVPEGQKTFNKAGKQNIFIMTYLNTIDP